MRKMRNTFTYKTKTVVRRGRRKRGERDGKEKISFFFFLFSFLDHFHRENGERERRRIVKREGREWEGSDGRSRGMSERGNGYTRRDGRRMMKPVTDVSKKIQMG